MADYSDIENSEEISEDRLSADEIANAEDVFMSVAEVERLTVSLPTLEARKLRDSVGDGSISKKIRNAVYLQMFLEDEVAAGGTVYVRTEDRKLIRVNIGP